MSFIFLFNIHLAEGSWIRVYPINADKLIKCLNKLGFREVRQRGSHKVFKNEQGLMIVVPYHKGEQLRKGYLRKVISLLSLSIEEFYLLVRDP